MILICANLAALVTLIFLFKSVYVASIIIGILVLIAYMVVQFSIFTVSGYKLGKVWYTIDVILIVVSSTALSISLARRGVT